MEGLRRRAAGVRRGFRKEGDWNPFAPGVAGALLALAIWLGWLTGRVMAHAAG